MNEMENSKYGPTALRVALGLLFIIPGLSKLANPVGIIKMLGELGFFAPALWGWVLLLSEIIFGAAVLIGWKVKYTVWPLVIIMIIAGFRVAIPNIGTNPMAVPISLFHLVAIAALVAVFLIGPGALAIKQK